MRLCSFEGCDKPFNGKGLCSGHSRQKSSGKELTPLRTRRSKGVDLTEWFWTFVNKTETCWLWTAGNNRGYGKYVVGGKLVPAHRYAYELLVGPIPEGLFIDHICYVRNCVNPDHLRVVTRKQNAENLSGLTSTNTSGYRGVSWRKDSGKWLAMAGSSYGGLHITAEDANVAAIALREKLFTHSDGR